MYFSPWEDEDGRQIPRRCAVFPIKVSSEGGEDKLSEADLKVSIFISDLCCCRLLN